jgi:hypothetical protein
MELDVNNSKLERKLQAAEFKERVLRASRYPCLFGYDNRNYSRDLCRLMEDCLRITPELRPAPGVLISRVNRGLIPLIKQYNKTRKLKPLLGMK